MKVKKVNRYYCEYCKKSSCSASHMSRHEKSCTANPNRHCRMCGRIGIDGLIESLRPGKTEADVERLRKEAKGCPACMLAAIRQGKFNIPADEDGPGFSVPFHFGTEKVEWWTRVNNEANQSQYYGY